MEVHSILQKLNVAEVAELVDALDSKSSTGLTPCEGSSPSFGTFFCTCNLLLSPEYPPCEGFPKGQASPSFGTFFLPAIFRYRQVTPV